MGATQCCSSDARCCGSNGSRGNEDGYGGKAPVGAKPLVDNEVMGIDNMPAPGMDMKTQIESPDAKDDTCKGSGGKDDSCAIEVCPGGDSAAGGGDKQEYQYVTYEDGSTYIGQISDGKRQGHGIWQSRTGQYEGQWRADAQHGKGRQTWSDGRVYDGQFQSGRFSGTGRMIWHTQKGMLIYEGSYQEDLKHGEGKFVWADGRTYNGEWQKGKRHGKGTYMNAKCERKTGYWIDDKFDRWETADAEKPANAEVAEEPKEQQETAKECDEQPEAEKQDDAAA